MSKLNKMREQIANEFIAALQKDEIPWHQDWHNIGGAPHNAVTGRFLAVLRRYAEELF